MVLAVYLLFSVACFFTVHEHFHRIMKVLYLYEPTALCYGVFRRAVRTEAVGTLMELLLHRLVQALVKYIAALCGQQL